MFDVVHRTSSRGELIAPFWRNPLGPSYFFAPGVLKILGFVKSFVRNPRYELQLFLDPRRKIPTAQT